MALTADDINLDNFLKKFTFTGDPSPGSKTPIALIDFLKIASNLKLDYALERLRQSL